MKLEERTFGTPCRGETLHFMQQQSEVNFSVETSEVFLVISTHEKKLLHVPCS